MKRALYIKTKILQILVDRLWRLQFAVNYGKYGSIGKFELKEFDTEEDCQKEAEKLIRSKIKKGYVEERKL